LTGDTVRPYRGESEGEFYGWTTPEDMLRYEAKEGPEYDKYSDLSWGEGKEMVYILNHRKVSKEEFEQATGRKA